MYKTLETFTPHTTDTESQKKDFVNYLITEFFNNDDNSKASIIKALHDKKLIDSMYSAYHACAELNVDDIKKTLAKKESQFKNAYSKMCYLFGILHRHIPENIEPQQAIKEDTTAKELDKEMIPLTDEEQEFFNGLENYTHDSNVKTLASYVINMFCDDGSNTSFKNELLQQFDSYNNDSLEQFIEFICKINTLLITFHIK